MNFEFQINFVSTAESWTVIWLFHFQKVIEADAGEVIGDWAISISMAPPFFFLSGGVFPFTLRNQLLSPDNERNLIF